MKKAQLEAGGHRRKRGQPLGADTARAGCSGGPAGCSPVDISEMQTSKPQFHAQIFKGFDTGAGDRRQLRVLAFSPGPCFSNQQRSGCGSL